MSGAIPPLPQYAFMAWCLVIAQGQLHLYTLASTQYIKDVYEVKVKENYYPRA